METLNGKDLMVFAGVPGGTGVRAVAVSTSCVLTLTQDAEEVSWRGAGRWRRHRAGWRSWSVTVDGLLPAAGADDVLSLVLEGGQDVVVAFYSVADHPDGEPPEGFASDGRLMRWGYAVVSDYSESGEDGSKASRSVTFTGTGELHAGETWAGDFYSGDFGSDFLV